MKHLLPEIQAEVEREIRKKLIRLGKIIPVKEPEPFEPEKEKP